MKKNYYIVLTLMLTVFLGIVSCSDEVVDSTNCADNFLTEFADEIAAINVATTAFTNDATTENCDNLKDAYQNYIDELQNLSECAALNGYQQEVNDATDEAIAELTDPNLCVDDVVVDTTDNDTTNASECDLNEISLILQPQIDAVAQAAIDFASSPTSTEACSAYKTTLTDFLSSLQQIVSTCESLFTPQQIQEFNTQIVTANGALDTLPC